MGSSVEAGAAHVGCIPTERGGGQVLANARGCGEGNCRSWRGSGTAAASGERAAAIGSVGLAGRDRVHQAPASKLMSQWL